MNPVRSEYNKLLERHNKAAAFMDSDAPDAEKDKWMPEFKKIVKRLNELDAQLTESEVCQ